MVDPEIIKSMNQTAEGLFGMRSGEAAGLRQLKNEDGEAIFNVEELEKIADVEGRQIAIETVFKMVESGLVPKADLPALLESFGYSDISPQTAVDQYKRAADGKPVKPLTGCAGWYQGQIKLHKEMFARTNEGKFVYDIAQRVGHEFGHSVVERLDGHRQSFAMLGESEESESYFTTEEIEAMLAQISPGEESAAMGLVERSGKAELLRKERLAELFGAYLSAAGDENQFLWTRMSYLASQNRPEHFSATPTAENLDSVAVDRGMAVLNTNKELFKYLKDRWPEIMEAVRTSADSEFDFDGAYDLFNMTGFDEEMFTAGAGVSSMTGDIKDTNTGTSKTGTKTGEQAKVEPVPNATKTAKAATPTVAEVGKSFWQVLTSAAEGLRIG